MSERIVGIDVGGTFTDVFLLDAGAQRFRVAKIPSTPADPSRAFIGAIGAALAGQRLTTLATVVHGTTVGTNALLQRAGARAGLITTRGFRDVLEMRRRDRPTTWGLRGQFRPVIERDRRVEVDERVLADGTLHTPLDDGQLRAAARALRDAGCDAVAVVFINAYANPVNERRARELLTELWPNEFVSVSAEILPEIREFERCSTTALNAYLQPVVSGYLRRLEQSLDDDGFGGETLIVQSSGGVMSVANARRLPIRTALSGPAAGVIASRFIAAQAGFDNVITCDMGGTSFDVSLISGGRSALAAQTDIDFGMTIRTPMIEMTTIGAGGGSIAAVDRGGLLQVGPASAGSDPGPVCYGLGNDRPTVTDANLVLGRINPERPIGGRERLDVAAAAAAIERHVGAALGLDAAAAADAIVRVANSAMAGAIRLASIERGHDPGQFVTMPFGGGGALHAGALLLDIGLSAALIPRFPGVNSALGCVIADLRHDLVQTINQTLDELDEEALNARLGTMRADGFRWLDDAGIGDDARELNVTLDMAYQGQTHSVDVTVTPDAGGRVAAAAVRDAFERRYLELFSRRLDGIPIRVLNLRVAVVGRRPKFDLGLLAPAADADLDAARRGERPVWSAAGWRPAALYERLRLPVGARVVGPALLEQPDTTIYIDPGLAGEVDRFGNVVIRRV